MADLYEDYEIVGYAVEPVGSIGTRFALFEKLQHICKNDTKISTKRRVGSIEAPQKVAEGLVLLATTALIAERDGEG